MSSVHGFSACVVLSILLILFMNCSLSFCRSLSVERSCKYENLTISAGKNFKPEPCMSCHCSRHGGKVTCAIKDCQSERNCLKFKKNSKSCCPECLQYGCAHTDGKVYPRGASIVKTECISCYCPLTGGETVCDVTPCEALDCERPKKKDGECCPYCDDDVRSRNSFYNWS